MRKAKIKKEKSCNSFWSQYKDAIYQYAPPFIIMAMFVYAFFNVNKLFPLV